MKRAFLTSEMDDSDVKELMRFMAARETSPPENVHGWGKMLVHPKFGESFFSWLMRQAWAFSITPKKMIQSEKEYWLIRENISFSLPRQRLLTLDVLPVSSELESVLRQRGLNMGINELQVDISKWFITKEPKVTKKTLKNYYHCTLRYCPLCWKDKNNRYFKILWRLPFVVVCLEHGVELKEFCSSCGGILFNSKEHQRSSVITLENFKEEWLINCRHCNHSLLEEIVEEKPQLARLQKKILNTLLSDSNWATPREYLIFWHTYLTAIKKQTPDHAEMHLGLMDTILKKPRLIPNPNYYSQELLAEIERRFQAVTLYLSGTPTGNLAKNFDLTEFSIREFARLLLDGKPIDEIIKRQFGYNGKFGLELAKAELRVFKAKHDRLPRSRDKMSGIIDAINRQEYVSFGIKKWNDLLLETFGEVNIEIGLYKGEQGLQRAVFELQTFKTEHGRLPTSIDKEMSGIISTINYREFSPFGIKTWNDLLMKTFGEINSQPGIYVGEKGLERAIAELRKFKAEHGRLPKISDKVSHGIGDAIKRGEWSSFGIKKWNDLLIKIFGEINNERGIYTGEEGLNRAITELLEFKAEHGRLPKISDKAINGVKAAIRRRAWVSFGIERWNDLLRKTFGEVNVEMGVYAGEYSSERGLELAQAELLEFKAEHGRLPNSSDKEMYRIKTVIRRREWAPFGIKKWNDLLRKTFGKVNTEKGIYTGKQGIERAVAELRTFKTKYNRLPKYTDKGMIGIVGAIRRKEWVPFGINIWNDLLEKAFGDTFSKKELYVGERGLERAVAELLAFKAAHGRLPKARDKEMGGIKAAFARGEWASFGINKWNDLLMRTFGAVNKIWKNYSG